MRQSHVFTKSPLEPHSFGALRHNLRQCPKVPSSVRAGRLFSLRNLLAYDADEAERMEHRPYKKINTHVND